MPDSPQQPGQDAVLDRLHALMNRDRLGAATPPPEKEVPLLVDIVEDAVIQTDVAMATAQTADAEKIMALTDLIQAEIADRLRPAVDAAFKQALEELRPHLQELVRQNLTKQPE